MKDVEQLEQMPAVCQSCSLRQQAIPERPNARSSISQNMRGAQDEYDAGQGQTIIASKAAALRPWPILRQRDAMVLHGSSDTRGLAHGPSMHVPRFCQVLLRNTII
ncbi:hypothetical protein [Limimaricola sp. AA108-03]|uniref:hypothetical protein n=1 Tax=Limimaricola sp. AA108-03 TaxID=3425945 RepID=UPI003D784D26